MDARLNEFVDKLKAASGANLKSVVLYGSAVTGEFAAGFSDFDLLCVLERAGAPELEKLRPALNWWAQQNHRAPLLFAAGEVTRTLDVFSIEWLDMQAHRSVLFGEDPLAGLTVPLDLHRIELERELRTQVLRLRHSFAMQREDKDVLALLANSVSSFAALFRHVLIALGEKPPAAKRDAILRLSERLRFDPAPFQAILDLREGKKQPGSAGAAALFADYHDAITQVVEEVDRLFLPGQK